MSLLTSQPLIISGLYASLTALMLIVFAYRVVKLRRKHKIGLGNGENEALKLANRVHANLIENAPMALVLFIIAESTGLASVYLHLIGTLWLVARLLHAIGLTLGKGGYHFGRFWGVLLTWLVFLSLIVVNLSHFVSVL